MRMYDSFLSCQINEKIKKKKKIVETEIKIKITKKKSIVCKKKIKKEKN